MASVKLCGTANAEIAGSASLGYDLVESDGDWSGEFEQRVNLGFRGSSRLWRMLGLNIGFVWYGKEFDFRTAFSPTYSLTLQGNNYSLSSGYSVRINRGVIDSQLYENLSLFLPDLPTVRLTYTRRGSRDTEEERRVDSSGENIQVGVADSIGPFRFTLNRREYNTKDKIRGPEHDVKSDSTDGDVTFARSFGPLLSINGRYGLRQIDTERAAGKTEGRTRDFSLGFRFSPMRVISLSATRTGRQEEREAFLVEDSVTKELPSVTRSDYLTDRFQLTLQPLEEIRIGVTYSNSDDTREGGTERSNESRGLTVSIEPLRYLIFSGRFMTRDSQEAGRTSSTIERNSFDVNVKPIERLQILTRLDRSKLTDFINELDNNRDSITMQLRARTTENLGTDVSYNWQRSVKLFQGEKDRDSRHQFGLSLNYSFARMLNLNFRINKNISSLRGSDTSTSGAISYVVDSSRLNVRYNRTSSPVKSSSLEEGRRVAQSFAATFSQEVNQNTELSLIYQGRFGSSGSGSKGDKRISFRVTSRF